MAKKSIVLSNGDGRVTFSNTGSAWIDDADASLNITTITASNLSLESVGSGIKLLQVSGSKIVTVNNASLHGSALSWNGTVWNTSSVVVTQYSGNVGGDLSGSFPNPKVVSVANVSNGTLPSINGGTGLSIPNTTDFVLKSSNNVLTALTGAASIHGNVLLYRDSTLEFNYTPAKQHVIYYTVPINAVAGNGNQSQFVWTKPAGHKMARIICQGAGGGGSSGHSFKEAGHPGAGGGSGGYSEGVLMLDLVDSEVTVSVGIGGLGGPGNPATGQNVWLGTGDSNSSVGISLGGAGGNSSFGPHVIAYGGGQTGFPWDPGSGGAGGVGNIFNGSSGGTRSGATSGNASGAGATNNSTGGGTGNAGVGGTVSVLGVPNQLRNFNYTVDSNGKAIDAAFGAGATGATWVGASTPKPTKPTFGGGGGGGSAMADTGQSAGGDGGDGFVIVISW